MLKPLSDLTKKDSTWTWGVEQQDAFEALKKTFIMAPVLRIPNDKDPFKLSTDASNFAYHKWSLTKFVIDEFDDSQAR